MTELTEAVLKVRRKGVTIIPKRLREAAGIAEGSEVKAKVMPSGILLRPTVRDPVGILENLPTTREGSAVNSVRSLRKRIERQVRG